MERQAVLKVLADDTRLKIVELLLRHNYCVRALARNIVMSEAAISQHLKMLREAGLLVGEKRGYFMHYDVNRKVLHDLAKEIDILADMKREVCTREKGNCTQTENEKCHNREKTRNDAEQRSCACDSNDDDDSVCHKGKQQPCDDTTVEFCHGTVGTQACSHQNHKKTE